MLENDQVAVWLRTGLYQIEVENQVVALFTGQVFIKDKEILPSQTKIKGKL